MNILYKHNKNLDKELERLLLKIRLLQKKNKDNEKTIKKLEEQLRSKNNA